MRILVPALMMLLVFSLMAEVVTTDATVPAVPHSGASPAIAPEDQQPRQHPIMSGPPAALEADDPAVPSSLLPPRPEAPLPVHMDPLHRNAIVGGSFVPHEGLYPWFVHAESSLGESCGGALVAQDLVLTAAHCFDAFKVGGTVTVGGITKGKGQRKKVLHKVVHPSFSGEPLLRYDFMMVKIEPTEFIRPIKYNKSLKIPNQLLTVMGHGRTKPGTTTAGDSSKTLQYFTFKYNSAIDCNAQYGSIFYKEDMLCAGVKGKYACSGDSGSPLVTEDNVVVGIHSWSKADCTAHSTGVYARVSAAAKWIEKTICQLTRFEICACFDPDGKALRRAVRLYFQDKMNRTSAEKTELHQLTNGRDIKDWCVDKVQKFARLFSAPTGIPDRFYIPTLDFKNVNISAWNVGRAETMDFMFYGQDKFNCDISGWDVRKVSQHSLFILLLRFEYSKSCHLTHIIDAYSLGGSISFDVL
jgi:V8-like Glu-specific endopeptidase